MKTVRNVKKYAKQFMKAAKAEEVPQAIEGLTALADLMEKDKNVKTFLVSPLFSEAERDRALTAIATKMGLSLDVAKYLIYLSSEMVIEGLGSITKAIAALYLESRKTARALVTSPAPISKDAEAELIGSLKRVTGKEIDLQFVTDPSLLGGVRIQVGSTMYDSSIKGQLGLLRDKLIKG
ncbi:MAG: ATP synthase F1 subunit delta [Chloroflexota bacterium]